MDMARKFGPSQVCPILGQLIQMLYGFSSSVSGEKGIAKPLISSYVIVVLSDMMITASDMITMITDVITELSDVLIDNSAVK
jgi:hypothetical protein